jgi:hypothetical protein
VDDFFESSPILRIKDTLVQVPLPEDHLRGLCLHFMWHGAVRPVRLCDIALMAESIDDTFDWDRCLSGTRSEREQVIVALRLAESILGASIFGAPDLVRDYQLQPWVITTMQDQWVSPAGLPMPHRGEIMRGPRAAYRTLAGRWPDSITAAVRTHASFDREPGRLVLAKAFFNHFAGYGRDLIPKQMANIVSRCKE